MAISKIQNYKDLIVWQRSIALVEVVYRLTSNLPASEQWGLVSQMRRAAVSVASNIAEGYGRQATGEYRHHLSYSRGSLLEIETQIIICQKLKFLSSEDGEPLLDEIKQLSRMLATLISRIV